MYIAVIGDIVESRRLKNRSAFQRKFESAISVANGRRNTESPFTITLGDEVQALYRTSVNLFDDLIEMTAQLHPVRIRFAIGIGPLETAVNHRAAIGMDGPAFHIARHEIELMKETGRRLAIQASNPAVIRLVRDAADLWSLHTNPWQTRRWKILAAMIDEIPADQIARELNVSTVAVYQNRKAGGLRTILDLGRSISRTIDAFAQEHS